MSDGTDFSTFREGLRRRYEEELAAMERERLDLLARVRPAGEALRALGAREAILFGSILRPNFFDRASDIDILVVGLPDDLVLKALGAVERATGIFEREINLVFDQMAPRGLVEEARRTGVPL
jgi:predicted nucleotidyltransferase